MCGIVAVLRRPSTRLVPDAGEILSELSRAAELLVGAIPPATNDGVDAEQLSQAAETVEAVDRLLRGAPGLTALLARLGEGFVADDVERRATDMLEELGGLEAALDGGEILLSPNELEEINAVLVRCKDAAWAVARDRVGSARAVSALAGPGVTGVALDAWWSIQVALASIDRLEVRGRDSAGVHVLVDGHGLDLDAADIKALVAERQSDPLFSSMSVRTPGGRLSLVYKAAAEIGELGDNTRALRTAIRNDALLARALARPQATVTVLGHTRWASVGIISQANTHPLNSDEISRTDGPYVTAALNGDVDNYSDLRLSEMLAVPEEVTTDAKVIPTLVSHRLADGLSPIDAFRATKHFGVEAVFEEGKWKAQWDTAPHLAAGKRSGALYRPRRGRLRSGQRTLRAD